MALIFTKRWFQDQKVAEKSSIRYAISLICALATILAGDRSVAASSDEAFEKFRAWPSGVCQEIPEAEIAKFDCFVLEKDPTDPTPALNLEVSRIWPWLTAVAAADCGRVPQVELQKFPTCVRDPDPPHEDALERRAQDLLDLLQAAGGQNWRRMEALRRRAAALEERAKLLAPPEELARLDALQRERAALEREQAERTDRRRRAALLRAFEVALKGGVAPAPKLLELAGVKSPAVNVMRLRANASVRAGPEPEAGEIGSAEKDALALAIGERATGPRRLVFVEGGAFGFIQQSLLTDLAKRD